MHLMVLGDFEELNRVKTVGLLIERKGGNWKLNICHKLIRTKMTH